MFKCIKEMPHLPGKTVLLLDVSGSMDSPLSGKSDLTRIDATCGLAMLAREICSHRIEVIRVKGAGMNYPSFLPL
jgi:hypothetical protein